ncbi:hypothetical protein N656DRAFT_744580 [Canariomyces notabilis]|uniref:Uncharacterized protein n=1 Tax=Canariomyces notabilis TaxID=2074819 RepID=A0AAN6TPE9_9PEZI|nr:hypothetical protein N656DRAFT_744580 [Canariomyces arenarius]
MEETYDVLRPGERQRLSIAWYMVARDCRDDESADGDTEANWPRQSRMPWSKEESGVATRVEEIVKAPPVEGTMVITEWDADLYMTKTMALTWDGPLTIVKVVSPLLYVHCEQDNYGYRGLHQPASHGSWHLPDVRGMELLVSFSSSYK